MIADPADVRDLAVQAVAAGFDDGDEIVEQLAVELTEDGDDGGDLEDRVRAVVAEVSAAHAAAQAHWPAVTDCDRLAAAFAALERDGVLVLQDFSCCSSCAESDVARLLPAAGPATRGFSYFHEQDTERAVQGGGLLLAFGGRYADDGDADGPDAEEAAYAVGTMIVEALEAQGLSPRWNGDTARRIEVPVTWQCRRGVLRRTPGA